MKQIALCPGSYDPVTLGHENIIRRAAKLYDEVLVCVADNGAKQYAFSTEERISLCKQVTSCLPNVKVIRCDGWLVDTFRETGATAIVKGLRNERDFIYEQTQADFNRVKEPTAETVFLTADKAFESVSSTAVKQRVRANEPLDGFINECIKTEVLNRLSDI